MGSTKRTNIFAIVEETSDMTLFDSRWVPSSTRLVVAGTDTKGHGILRVYTMKNSNELSQVVNIERKRHPLKCLTFGASSFTDRHPATGDFDGNINVWDLENKVPVWSTKGHSSIVNAIDGAGGKDMSLEAPSTEVVTGSRDGSVKVWDVRTKDRPIACMQPMEGCATHDCWTVAFGSVSSTANKIVAAGFDNGDVKLFDLRSMRLYSETHVSTGVCSIAFDSSFEPMRSVSATCLQGFFHVWDIRSSGDMADSLCCSEKISKQNHTIWGVRYLRQNSHILATIDGSGSVKIWKYNRSTESSKHEKQTKIAIPACIDKLQESQVADQPISSFDWSPDMLGLAVSTSFDQKVRILAFTNLDKL